MTRNPPSHADFLVYLSRNTEEQRRAQNAIADYVDGSLRDKLQNGLLEVALDRLRIAEDFLRIAQSVMIESSTDEAWLRLSVNRGYYASHQAVRALLLLERQNDVDGHMECIEAFKKFLKEPANQAACGGFRAELAEDLSEAIANRHVADYSPYTQMPQVGGKSFDRITKGDWSEAAAHNARTAQDTIDCAWKFVSGHPLWKRRNLP